MANPDSQESKYWKLMNELKQKIVDGTYQAGDKMSSENELAAFYQVSRHTVRKALAILEHEGYIYAVHGKGTFCSEMGRHTKTSRNIAVVTTYLSDYIFPSVIQGIDQVMTDNGYSILLKNTKNSSSAEGKCLEELLSKDIEGLIIEPSKSEIYCRHIALYKKLDEFHIPYVFIQGTMEQLSDRPYVMMDDFKGGYLITKYLLSLGHRRILGMFKADDRQGIERHRGYAKRFKSTEFSTIPTGSFGFTQKIELSSHLRAFERWPHRAYHLIALSATTTRLQSRQFRHCLSLDFVYQKTSP